MVRVDIRFNIETTDFKFRLTIYINLAYEFILIKLYKFTISDVHVGKNSLVQYMQHQSLRLQHYNLYYVVRNPSSRPTQYTPSHSVQVIKTILSLIELVQKRRLLIDIGIKSQRYDVSWNRCMGDARVT